MSFCLQGWRVDLPIKYAKFRGQQGKYPIKLFYTVSSIARGNLNTFVLTLRPSLSLCFDLAAIPALASLRRALTLPH